MTLPSGREVEGRGKFCKEAKLHWSQEAERDWEGGSEKITLRSGIWRQC